MNHDTDPIEIKITQDKLVDLLLHAATREDISTLRQEMKEETSILSKRMEAFEARVNDGFAESKRSSDAFEARVNDGFTESKRSSNAFETRVEDGFAEFRKSRDAFEVRVNNHFRWVIGTIVGATLTIIGVSLSLANFLTHYISHT